MRALRAIVFFCLLAFPLLSISQGFRINKAMLDSNGNLRLEFTAETNSYYVLERAETTLGAMQPVTIQLAATTNGIIEQPVDRPRAFYRLRSIPLDAPQDTDQDGLNDIYELRRQPALNPLDPSDAGAADPDGNGLTYLQRYRAVQFDSGKHRIAAGDHHFLALKSDGTLWACGENRFGQLGDGTTNNSVDLISIEPGFRWLAVAAGGLRSYGIRSDGSLWAWGQGAVYAPLGDGNYTNHLRPTRIGQDNDWQFLAVSLSHTMALKQDGSLWGWGNNSTGQLGDVSLTNQVTPARIGTDTHWVDVAVGQNLTLALKDKGELFAFGNNEWGQLGIATTNNAAFPTPVASNFTWLAIGAGDFQGLGIRDDHTLWAWGELVEVSAYGYPILTNRFAPTQVGTNSNWLRVVGGYRNAVAFDMGGAIWSFGLNQNGEAGEGTHQPRPYPTRIGGADHWTSVDAKSGNHVGIRADGTLWNWSGANGQLAASTGLFKPVMAARRFRSVAAGDYHSVAIDDAGSVWTWGANESGQLGDGSSDFGLPRRIATNIVVTSVSAGGKHCLAIDQINQLWMLGSVLYGQTSWGNAWPMNFGWFSTNAWAMADGGGSHWLGLDSQGNLLAFGDNSYHQQPGESSYTNQYTTISAGGWSSFAIDTSGYLNMWGQFVPSCCFPYSGRLNTCVSNFQSVIAGAQHALAIRVDGTLWSMGDNTWGQLGIGTNHYACMEKPVMTNFTWKSAAAYYHNLAIRADGTLWFWGYGGSNAPSQISTNAWKVVAAGYKHSLALQEDGSLWAWGNNDYGQLGLNPFTEYSEETAWKPPSPR